jgi:hypothetical protein
MAERTHTTRPPSTRRSPRRVGLLSTSSGTHRRHALSARSAPHPCAFSASMCTFVCSCELDTFVCLCALDTFVCLCALACTHGRACMRPVCLCGRLAAPTSKYRYSQVLCMLRRYIRDKYVKKRWVAQVSSLAHSNSGGSEFMSANSLDLLSTQARHAAAQYLPAV